MMATKAKVSPSAVRRDVAPDPERPTLPERLLRRMPGPYLVSGLVLAVFLNFPGYLLVHLLDTGTVHGALAIDFQGRVPETRWQQIAAVAAWTVLTAFTLWMARAIRRRVTAAEGVLAPLLPEGVVSYRAAFSRLAATWPPLLIALLLAAATYPYTVAAFREAAGPGELAYYAVRLPLQYIIFGAALWAYIATLWGVRELGRQPLRLQPFREDSMLGLRPIGALVLAVSLLFFGFLAIFVAIALLSPIYGQLALLVVALTVVGVLLFFVPLDGVHRQMAAVKTRELAELHRAVLRLVEAPELPQATAAPVDLGVTLAALSTALTEWRRGIGLEAAERRVASMPVWPFDTAILRRLGAAALSILVAAGTSAVVALAKRWSI